MKNKKNYSNQNLETLLSTYQNGIPDDLADDKKIEILSQFPKYVHGAICSQSSNLSKRNGKERKILCYAAAVSFFIKFHGRFCFSGTDTLLNKYNELSTLFHVKTVKRSSFFTIQMNALESGLVIRHPPRNDRNINKNYRDLEISFPILLAFIKSAFSKAFTCAKNLLNRFLDRGRQRTKKHAEAAPILESQPPKQQENRTIIKNTESKDSKKINKYKAIPAKDFYLQFFKEDATTVQELQHKARTAKIYDIDYKHFYFNRSDALELIRLHTKHNVRIGNSLMSFLKWTINRGHVAIKKRTERETIEKERQKIINACYTWAKNTNADEKTAYDLLIRKLNRLGMKTNDIPTPKAVATPTPKSVATPKSKDQERIDWIKAMPSEYQRRYTCKHFGIDYDQLMSEIVYC